ncbi:hypothetical protein BDK89_0925 [Ilumatobacter fluminis]|uniref:Uncharacterized protein n=1 Tax=Ilumatobacter fluminis TaxID=467091 RepID=A0A4R7HWM1_9ACTN|nr:hypothetical protein [Ilumatobacter fluminis]TDT15355.1 hypothetical protein BDK89_0925 [Ilumatobacter fluminis]
MEHGPVPPHERSWRHPSEVAADETAELRAVEVPRSTRAFALATGSLGLVALGVFVLVMTPSRDGTPIAVSATTTAVVSDIDDGSAAPTVAAVRRPVADVTTAALATPIGDGDYAVVVRTTLDRSSADRVDVVLPSGRTVSGAIVDENADTALVHLSINEPGHRIAERRPHDHDVVTVLATPPVEVAFADVDQLDVADGTAVVDADGDLVGLCSRGTDGTKVLMVDDDMAAMDDDAGDEQAETTADGDGEDGDTETGDEQAGLDDVDDDVLDEVTDEFDVTVPPTTSAADD